MNKDHYWNPLAYQGSRKMTAPDCFILVSLGVYAKWRLAVTVHSNKEYILWLTTKGSKRCSIRTAARSWLKAQSRYQPGRLTARSCRRVLGACSGWRIPFQW